MFILRLIDTCEQTYIKLWPGRKGILVLTKDTKEITCNHNARNMMHVKMNHKYMTLVTGSKRYTFCTNKTHFKENNVPPQCTKQGYKNKPEMTTGLPYNSYH